VDEDEDEYDEDEDEDEDDEDVRRARKERQKLMAQLAQVDARISGKGTAKKGADGSPRFKHHRLHGVSLSPNSHTTISEDEEESSEDESSYTSESCSPLKDPRRKDTHLHGSIASAGGMPLINNPGIKARPSGSNKRSTSNNFGDPPVKPVPNRHATREAYVPKPKSPVLHLQGGRNKYAPPDGSHGQVSEIIPRDLRTVIRGGYESPSPRRVYSPSQTQNSPSPGPRGGPQSPYSRRTAAQKR